MHFLLARRYASAGTSHGLVSVSVSSWCSIEMSERIVLVFGTGASFACPALCLMESTYLQNKCTFFWNFAPDSGLEDFATAYRS